MSRATTKTLVLVALSFCCGAAAMKLWSAWQFKTATSCEALLPNSTYLILFSSAATTVLLCYGPVDSGISRWKSQHEHHEALRSRGRTDRPRAMNRAQVANSGHTEHKTDLQNTPVLTSTI